MARTDKKNRECICCGKILVTSQKLRQHYASTKNQCRLPLTSSNPVQDPNPQVKDQGDLVPRPRSPTSTPVVHVQGKDRRREKPEPIPKMQDKDQGGDPGPSTQAYDLELTAREGKYIDRHARKPREHLKTWGARLR